MKNTIIQLHSTTPEQFKNDLKSMFEDSLKKFKLETSSYNPEKILTREETANILSISLVTLWSWTKNDIIRAHRIGNQVRYKQKDITEALQKVNGNSTSIEQ